jgi:hypothetical protein
MIRARFRKPAAARVDSTTAAYPRTFDLHRRRIPSARQDTAAARADCADKENGMMVFIAMPIRITPVHRREVRHA